MFAGHHEAVQSMYSKKQLLGPSGDPNAVTLWDVVVDLLGPSPSGRVIKPNATICIDTPFGKVCFEVKTAELNEEKLKAITLGDVLSDIFSRPRMKGACFEVCHWGVCVIVCL